MPPQGALAPPPKAVEEKREFEKGQGIIIVLEGATLEVGKVGKTMQLLNCDDHKNFLTRHEKDPSDYRPDITHQELLSVLDSPLCKAGERESRRRVWGCGGVCGCGVVPTTQYNVQSTIPSLQFMSQGKSKVFTLIPRKTC